MKIVRSPVRSVVSNVVRSVVSTIRRVFLTFDSTLNSYGQLSTAFTPTGSFKIKGKFSTTSTAEQWIYARYASDADERSILVRYSTNLLWFYVSNDGTNTTLAQVAYVPVGKFSKFEATFNASTNIILTVDGVTTTTPHAYASVYDADTPSYFGSKTASTHFFQGVLADIELIDLDVPSNSQAYRLDRATENYELPINNVTGSELWDSSNAVDVGASITPSATGFTGAGSTTNTVSYSGAVSGIGLANGDVVNVQFDYSSAVGAQVVGISNSSCFSGSSSAKRFQSGAGHKDVTLVVNDDSLPLVFAFNNAGGVVTNISIEQVTNALVYNNIPESKREQFKLVGATNWINISPAPQQLPATLQVP